ncbi:MAG: hypothetical protein AAB391_00095 [Patescibacteria group bacterium]
MSEHELVLHVVGLLVVPGIATLPIAHAGSIPVRSIKICPEGHLTEIGKIVYHYCIGKVAVPKDARSGRFCFDVFVLAF